MSNGNGQPPSPMDALRNVRGYSGTRNKLEGAPGEVRCKACGRKLFEVELRGEKFYRNPGVVIKTRCHRCGANLEIVYLRDKRGVPRLSKVKVLTNK